MENPNTQSSINGDGQPQNVQPMPGMRIAAAYGKVALAETGRFLRISLAAGIGCWGAMKFHAWRTTRAAAATAAANNISETS